MNFGKDYFGNPIVPDYVLCKANREQIGVLNCTTKHGNFKFNDINEISFSVHMNIEDKKNPYYEAIDTMKYVLLPNIGFFYISECEICSEGTKFEYKNVSAKSYQCLMGQKYIENFVINMGTPESVDNVSFYNLSDKQRSLLHLILRKCPGWRIGHIDSSLFTMQRSFEVNKQDIYSFLIKDVAKAFGCVFIFDTLTNRINIYKEKDIGEDTDIYISYNNLLENVKILSNVEDIKTSIALKGSDDLTVREVNMGQDTIVNIDYYHSTEYMSQSLYDSYKKWKTLRESKIKEYNTLLSQYQDYFSKINHLTHVKIPENVTDTDWTKYGLNPLKEQLASYEQKQAVMMKSGWGNKTSPYYATSYLPVYNAIADIKAQIASVEIELEHLKTAQNNIYNLMFNIMNIVAIENNFTEKELAELSTFIREDELTSDNYIVTDNMTDEERFAMLEDFLAYGREELKKVSTPQLKFSSDIGNIFLIPEFETLYEKFDLGNYIWVSLRDDYHVKTRLTEINIDFYNQEDFSVTFGNVIKKSKSIYSDISDALKYAKDASTSVSFNKSNWSQSAKDTDEIGKMLNEGLLSAGKYISNGDDSEMKIDKRGIFITTVSGDYSQKDSIFIGGGRILFTDDSWKTISEAIGRVDIKGESVFGVIAQAMLSGYIASSVIEGGQIIGVEFNNGNKTFYVDKNGNLIANSATIKGIVEASKIKGSEIIGTSINNGNGTFTVDKDGNVTAISATIKGNIEATSGKIGEIIIENNNIHSLNNKFKITSEGYAEFKDLYINGVRVGSSFGGVNIGNNGLTSGNFDNGFSANTSFGLGGGALQQFNNLVANKVTAAYIDATVQLSAKYATIGDLNVTKNLVVGVGDRVTTIENDYIRTAQLEAVNARFKNLNASNITAGTISLNRIADASKTGTAAWTLISYIKGLKNCGYTPVKNTSGQTVSAVTDINFYYGELYVLAGSNIIITED